jgi:subtilisin family serine protease
MRVRAFRAFALAASASALLACPNVIDPIPNPDPGPGGGFDCESSALPSGLVSVADAIPGRYIVVFKDPQPGVRAAGVEATARSFLQEHELSEVAVFDSAIAGFSCGAAAEEAERMAADPRVAFVQQDGRKQVSPIASQEGATWGLDRSDQRDLPLDGRFEPGAEGVGVHAYIIDTGMDTSHVEFANRVGEGFSATGDGTVDDDGHGTHVAGTVGGGEFGIAKQVTLHPVRVLVNGSGSDSQVIAGVDWVARHVREHGWPAVANMSLGGSASPALDRAVCNSIQAGVSFAIAAGNESQDACNTSPARVVQALTVGASDRSDARASFSNFGSCVDVFAPGRDISSARRGGGSTVLSGTSMASPHVAGVSALCLERKPGATPREVASCVVESATRDKLTSIGDGSPNRLLYARGDAPAGVSGSAPAAPAPD